jgi:hypothetical protein
LEVTVGIDYEAKLYVGWELSEEDLKKILGANYADEEDDIVSALETKFRPGKIICAGNSYAGEYRYFVSAISFAWDKEQSVYVEHLPTVDYILDKIIELAEKYGVDLSDEPPKVGAALYVY